ncbi:MarR family transcriptional regulator [Nocardioides panaciterrulae]|uniref:DNA-binding MarR family transcriptional regulator n=1 Tax=Nocardioides panaciterrulae TaxID=661492 RepID=A0A7Y9J9F4_9ACTN|nr:DNA-binding MarR family transcriptional regulator [Nocardioides panaciterrulae]
MTRTSRSTDELAEAYLTASRVFVGLAVQSLAAAPVEITLAQHRVLVLLASHGRQQIGDIAAELRINPSNATRHCDRLQKLGLLARQRSTEDGRVVQVALTEAGRRVVDAVSDARRQEIARLIEEMPVDERSAVLAALESFAEAASERADQDWVTNVW